MSKILQSVKSVLQSAKSAIGFVLGTVVWADRATHAVIAMGWLLGHVFGTGEWFFFMFFLFVTAIRTKLIRLGGGSWGL